MRPSVVRLLALPGVAVALLALMLPGASAAKVPAGVITTIAGGPGGPAPGPRVSVDNPCGVTFGKGKAYFTEAGADLVRRLDPGTGWLSTVAGTGTNGLDGTIGSDPALRAPCGTAVDAAGNVVFDVTGDNVVAVTAARTGTFYGVKMLAGHAYVVAGGGSGTGTPARRAALIAPTAVVVDPHGNLLVSSGTAEDTPFSPTPQSAMVVVVGGATGTFYGQRMVPGGIYVLAGDPCGSAIGGAGCPPGLAGDGGPAASATFGTVIQAITRDAVGDVLLTDTGENVVRLIAATSRKLYGQTMKAGDIYTIAGGGTSGLGDNGPARQATLSSPQGVAVTANGNVVVSDAGDQRIRLVAATSGTFYGQVMTGGNIYTIAGNGTPGFAGDKGPARSAEVRSPSGAALDGAGDVVFADAGNNRVRFVAARTGLFYRQRMAAGDIYTVAGNGQLFDSGDGVLATSAQLNPFLSVVSDGSGGREVDPGGLAVSPAGRNIIIADAANHVVRVVAETTGVFYGRRLAAGHIYTVAGGPGARLANPVSVAADAAGNILVSDIGYGGAASLVRVIAVKSGRFYGKAMQAGHLYTVASLGIPIGLAVDHNGNVLVAAFISVQVLAVKSGRFYGQRMTAGQVYTISGDNAEAVAVDHAGNVITVNDGDNIVTVLAVRTGRFYGQDMTAGHSYTVAGVATAQPGYSGDRGPAVKARLDSPAAVAVDSAGNLLVADSVNSAVRVIAERTGSFYGVHMTAGDIYTVAGGNELYEDGTYGGFSGDGGPAVKAVLFDPCGIAPFGTGLVVLDDRNYRVRAVSG